MRAFVHTLFALVVTAALALTLSPARFTPPLAAVPAGDRPAVPLEPAEPTKILPLGDSNTGGVDEALGGYRTDLWQLLRADGRAVDFVGSGNAGKDPLGDKDHEGHGGFTITQIQNIVVNVLATYTPDVVLLQIGTNDMYRDDTAGAAPGNLSRLLDTIANARPNTRIFVSDIPLLRNTTHYKRVVAFNATIPGMVAAKAATGKKISFLAAHGGLLQPDDLVDEFHPHYGPISKAAARWYTALTGLPLTRYEAEQTANATVVNAYPTIPLTAASGGATIGHIDFSDSSVTFNVQVGAAGQYRIRARGSNGTETGAECSHQVSANQGPKQTVRYPNYGWTLFTMAAVDLPLTLGTNTITFTKGACYAELDSIDLGPVPPAS